MIESKLTDAPVAMDQDTLQSQPVNMDTASKIVDEYRDREMRKSNIIIYNIPEPKSKDSPGQKKMTFTVKKEGYKVIYSTAYITQISML